MTLNEFNAHFKKSSEAIMPALFVGHGNPMNAIEDNEFSRGWITMGKQLPTPTAILCISAHWQTAGTKVTAMANPKTIHDFYGFPQALFDVQYLAPGSPQFAEETKHLITKTTVESDFEWGLDHGCWSVLNKMFPEATIPVYQLSLDYTATAQSHFDLAKQLSTLRKKGILILGSGNIVHNLRLARIEDFSYDWAIEFDEQAKQLIEQENYRPLINYNTLGKAALLSIPTNEHYLPLLYTLAQKDKKDNLQFFNAKTTAGSISMRSFILS